MGNHNSNQGKYDFPTACVLPIDDDRPITHRSQSFKHETTRSRKYSGFSTSRRCTINNISISSEDYLGGKVKKTKSHRNSFSFGTPSLQEEKSFSLAVVEESGPAWSPSIKTIEAANQAKQVTRMSVNLDKFAKQLTQLSKSMVAVTTPKKHVDENTICRAVFQKHVVTQSKIAEEYLWDFFMGLNPTFTHLKASAFIQGAEKVFAPITDKDQITFYVQIFGRGKDTIERNAFMDLLISAYQLSSSRAGKAGRALNNSDQFDGKEWLEAITKACFHIKGEMSVFFVSNWILVNLPRLLIPMHKYLAHQLTSGYLRMAANKKDNPDQTDEGESGASKSRESGADDIHPILMWLLLASLPSTYLSVFEQKSEQQQSQQVKQLSRIDSRDLLLKLLYNEVDSHEYWSLLYNSEDQGLSINRFQFHVFNYRGPTLMVVKCDNDYTFLVGADVEWKENCHFWGGANSFMMQLKPEFRVVEKGAKSLYANFSIRGYPFGFQVGQDPRNISLEIKPDFEYAYFKKIPCRIIKLVVWGCAPSPAKTAQAEHKKWEAKQSEKQRKIDLTNVDWNDNPDKYLLELGGNYKSYGN